MHPQAHITAPGQHPIRTQPLTTTKTDNHPPDHYHVSLVLETPTVPLTPLCNTTITKSLA